MSHQLVAINMSWILSLWNNCGGTYANFIYHHIRATGNVNQVLPMGNTYAQIRIEVICSAENIQFGVVITRSVLSKILTIDTPLFAPWWRHQTEIFSALLALCVGNSPVPVNSPHKGQWRGALIFSLIFDWINSWVNNRGAGDLRRHRAHHDVIVMRQGEVWGVFLWVETMIRVTFQFLHIWYQIVYLVL